MKSNRRKPVILLNTAVSTYMNRECELLISNYAEKVSDSGALPLLLPSLEKTENICAALDIADGVVLIGGKDYPPQYYNEIPRPETGLDRLRPHFDIAFAGEVMRRQMPVLGICAGCQLLNIVAGGKLIQHLPNAGEHTGGTMHQAAIVKEGFFSRALGKKAGDIITVNSFHHQALDKDHLGSNLTVTAQAFDGSVEAVEYTGSRMILGVQFHPERMEDTGKKIFDLLCHEAVQFQNSCN
ncbi:MAG: gamma-glutamyl-gamma-aminobutyrate hydrolase family protein [Lentisphaeria bacterium]|nr:gamma-glutamyl-gamma-aminobutyrate hydrolase family protein [Lentisphaeria bacterium]